MLSAAATRPDPLAVHGGNLAEARRRFPQAPQPWLDLSTGLNAIPYPVPTLPPEAWTRLPAPAAVEHLEMVARQAYGVAGRSDVVAAPGSAALLARLPTILAGRDIRILGPTYGGHAQAWRAAGRPASIVADAAMLEGADVAVVVNPNNPDGRLIPRAATVELADRIAGRGGTLVVDEAFMDVLEPGCGLLPGTLPESCMVLRSLGKTYGLGGLRLGFAVMDPDRAETLREALGAWPVSGPAVVVGSAALSDGQWLDDTRRRLRADVAALDGVLAAAGCSPVGGTPLFRLVAHHRAPLLFDTLALGGILARPFPGTPWLRFGVPCSESDRVRLDATLGKVPADLG